MKKLVVLSIAVLLTCGMVYGEPRGAKEFEGELLKPSLARKLEKAGQHRYYDQFMTHNAHELKHEIDLLNMLNSLYLTDVQMNSLILVSTEMERARRKHTKEIAKLNRVLEEGFAGLRKRAMAGEQVGACDVPESCKAAQKRLGQIRRELSKKKLGCQTKVKALLTENQVEKIYNYEHCLIPVKDLKDPTRIGQADAVSGNEKLLKRVRAMSEEQFGRELAKISDCHIKKIEHKCGEMPSADKKKESERFVAVLVKARKMEDLDFEFGRAKVAAELSSDYYTVRDRMMHVKMRLGKVRHDECGARLDVVGSMFLSPNMLHILAKRTNINKGFRGTEAVDLDKIEHAATTAGGCAID